MATNGSFRTELLFFGIFWIFGICLPRSFSRPRLLLVSTIREPLTPVNQTMVYRGYSYYPLYLYKTVNMTYYGSPVSHQGEQRQLCQ